MQKHNQQNTTHFRTPQLQRISLKLNHLLQKWEQTLLESVSSAESWSDFFVQSLSSVSLQLESIHRLYDEYQQEVIRTTKEPVFCKNQCSACCCHYPMSVEAGELVHLYLHIRKRPDFAEILERCHERSEMFHSLLKKFNHENNLESQEESALQSYFDQQLPCPFLDVQQNCSVYQFRPITCRMYLSHSDPKFCGPADILTDRNKNFMVYLDDRTEEFFSEVNHLLAFLELPDSLFEGILALNFLESEIHDH